MATGNNSDQEERPPSFFKVIRDPSDPHLALPKAFVRRYFEKIPKNPRLVSVTGEHSWRMEFAKVGDDYSFVRGWEKLVEDVGLCSRDIVVCWMIDPLTFSVSFLGANECEKDLPVNKINDDDGVKDDDDGQDVDMVHEGHDDVMADENLCFEKVFRRTFRYYMRMPVKFVKAAGLDQKKSIKLKDYEGKEWTIGILAERYKGTKYSLTAGWSMFRKYHKLSDGDVCTFTFNKKEDVLNLTQVFKSKKPIKQETLMEEVNTCYVGANVKIEDEWSPIGGGGGGGGGGVEVKVEYESGPEMELVKRKRGRATLMNGVNVKIEDGSVPEMVVGKRRWEVPPPEKLSMGDRVVVNNEPGTEGVFRCKHVVYF